jgi:hypothetical protein
MLKKKKNPFRWLTSVIFATCEAEIRRIAGQGQLEQIFHKIPSPK